MNGQPSLVAAQGLGLSDDGAVVTHDAVGGALDTRFESLHDIGLADEGAAHGHQVDAAGVDNFGDVGGVVDAPHHHHGYGYTLDAGIAGDDGANPAHGQAQVEPLQGWGWNTLFIRHALMGCGANDAVVQSYAGQIDGGIRLG